MPKFKRKTLSAKRTRIQKYERVLLRIGQFLIVCQAIYMLLFWVSMRPSYRITNIDVEGVLTIGKDDFISIAKEELSRPILGGINRGSQLFYPHDRIHNRLAGSNPRIADVGVWVKEHTLYISVEERKPSFLACLSAKDIAAAGTIRTCYFSDDQGYIFSEAPEFSGDPFLLFLMNDASTTSSLKSDTPIGSYAAPPKEFLTMIGLRELLAQKGAIVRSFTALESPGDYRLLLSTGKSLLVTLHDDPAKIVAHYVDVEKIIEKNPAQEAPLGEIDLRFGNKVFFR